MTRLGPDWLARLPRTRLIAEYSMWSANLLRLEDDLTRIAPHADILHVDVADVQVGAETSSLYVFWAPNEIRSFFGLFARVQKMVRVTDKTGVVRLQRSDAVVQPATVSGVIAALEKMITRLTDFGDAGRSLPDVHLLIGRRIVDLSGLAEMEQVLALAGSELENLPEEETVVIVASQR